LVAPKSGRGGQLPWTCTMAIGQQLVGLSMTSIPWCGVRRPKSACFSASDQYRARSAAIAQRVIADLSPPGLYELVWSRR